MSDAAGRAFKVVIPARHASARLPGKPLLDVAGKPLVRHVWERAIASGARAVVVATDDARVRDAALSFGADVRMTSAAHASGTERAAEVVDLDGDPDDAIVVNVQGDEPLLAPRNVVRVAEVLAADAECEMATLCEPIEDDETLFDPSAVKVVIDALGRAIYFSRAPIPWHRDHFAAAPGTRPAGARHWLHVGVYAYRAGFLRRYVRLDPCEAERAESLEQLRALHHGARIRVAEAPVPPGPGVDTASDLEKVRRVIERRSA